VLNHGERAEGFISPLHLLVSILILLLPGGVVLFKAKLVSLALGILGLMESRRLLRLLPLPVWGERLALALCGGSWVLAFARSDRNCPPPIIPVRWFLAPTSAVSETVA
jgi:hypothetical protein